MEASCQNEILKNALQNYQSPFETVLIPDGEFEVFYPQSSPSKGSDVSNLPDNKLNVSEIGLVADTDFSEKFTVPPHLFLTNEIQEESFIVEKLGSLVKSNDFNQNDGCGWVAERSFEARRAQSNDILLNETQDRSKQLLSLTSPSGNGNQELINNGSNAQITKNSISKRKIRALKCQQKEQYLKENLKRIDEAMCSTKKIVSNGIPSNNLKVNKRRIRNFIDSPASKTIKRTQIKTQSSKVIKPKVKVDKLNTTSNVHFDDSRECNIDDLKKCIIEASRALIKTEKSLKILGKLMRSEVVVEKQAAVHYLKNFQYTVNNFRKTITGIDKNLSTRYRDVSTELVGESSLSKDNLDCQRSTENIVDYQSLLNREKQIEIIIPAVATEEVREISDNSTCSQDNNLSCLQACYPNQYTVNNFRKTITGIDKNLSTRYRDVSTELVGESSLSKDNLDCQKSTENIVDYQSLLNREKQIEIIIPAVATEEVREISDNSTCSQDNNLSRLQACYPNLEYVQRIQLQKRIPEENNLPCQKKVKTRIIHGNWRSNLGENSLENRRFSNENSIQSQENVHHSKLSCEPIIILD